MIYTVISFLFYDFSGTKKQREQWQSFQLNTMWFDMYIPLRDQGKLPSKEIY